MADGDSRRKAWEVIAKTQGKALASPVVRGIIGWTDGGLGKSESHEEARVAPKQDLSPARDELLRRMLTANKVGYGQPGPGVLTAAALRPDVRALFEDQGGLVAVDITDMPPAVAEQLTLLLDPDWTKRRAQR